MDPHYCEKLDPDLLESGKLDPDPHWSEKQDPDPDPYPYPYPHQSKKVGALEGHAGAMEDPNLGKSEW
jgi:hypothetical protein